MGFEGRIGIRQTASVAKDLYSRYIGYQASNAGKDVHFASEIAPLRNIAEDLLRLGITPNQITLSGGIARSTGSVMMGRPDHVRSTIKEKTGKEIPTRVIAATGTAIWITGLLCDALDGEMAHQSTKNGLGPGETKVGRVVDGLTDIVSLLALSQLIEDKPDSSQERVGWAALDEASFASTLIRSSARGEGIEIGKADTGSQVGIEAITVASHAVEIFQKKRAEGHLGAILSWVRARDAFMRYRMVLESGDSVAIARVTQDLGELFGLGMVGAKISDRPFASFLLKLLKVGDVMYGEVNEGNRPSSIIAQKASNKLKEVGKHVEIFNRKFK